MKDLIQNLNPPQREAVEYINGPLLVLAGAGTGKTRVITFRIANMLNNGIPPENILALTFTNKAAKEMKERVCRMVDKNVSDKVFLGTYHSFCMRILRREVRATRLFSGFTVADDVDQAGILKQIIIELNLEDHKIAPDVYLSHISNAKNELMTPEEYQKRIKGFFDSTISKVYMKYQETLKLQNMVDFDDILMLTVKLFEENPEILNKYRDICRYILVDEFQDTNYAQFRIIKLLAEKHANICVVGDDDQSIYGWRGARVDNILKFPDHFPNTKIVKLEQNYRSTNNILNAANTFISSSKRRYSKNLWSNRGDGYKIRLSSLENDISEAMYIAKQIHMLTLTGKKIDYNDIAVLYRSNHQSRLFEQELRKANIPYRIIGSKSFYERKEIRDAVCYLKFVANLNDDQSFLRIMNVPPRGFGDKFVERMRNMQGGLSISLFKIASGDTFIEGCAQKQKNAIRDFCNCITKWHAAFAEQGKLADKTKSYFNEIGFLNGFQKIYKNIEEAEDRRDNVIEFINSIAQYEDSLHEQPSLIDFLEKFALTDDSDRVDEDEQGRNNSVTLLTVHSAKGLEFPCVFIVGMEQNLFPHVRSLEERDIDEEKRLFYVALTRAKEYLYLTNARARYKYGSLQYQVPSEFLSAIPEELTEAEGAYMTPVSESSFHDAFGRFYSRFGKQ